MVLAPVFPSGRWVAWVLNLQNGPAILYLCSGDVALTLPSPGTERLNQWRWWFLVRPASMKHCFSLSKLNIRVMMPIKWCDILKDKHDRCENIINHPLSRNTKFSQNLVIWVCHNSHNIRLQKSVTQIAENKTKRSCQYASPAKYLKYH